MRTEIGRRSARAAAIVLGLVLVPGALAAQDAQPAAPPADAVPAASTAQTEAPARPARVRRNANQISTEELAATTLTDLFSVVQSLRPRWLQTRGPTSIALSEVVRVYVDGVRVGSPGALRSVQTRSVRSVRYLDGRTATQRYGTDHGAGAIMVELN